MFDRRRASAARVAAALFAFAAVVSAQFVGDVRIHEDVPPGQVRPTRPRLHQVLVDKHVVRATFADGVATTTIRQVFRNPNGFVLEGTYFFPLPEDAALGGFSMLMGGKMVAGEVLEKEKAASIYRDIVSRSLDPALLEYVGRRLFRAKVFPIPARGTAEVELTYSETIARSGETLEYRYPLRTQGASPAPVNELSVSITCESKTPMRAVYSPSHKVDVVKKGDYAFAASYEEKGVAADRDFVLVVGLGADPVGATLLTHMESEGEGAFVLLLSPSEDATKADALPKDVLFVADTSGSMAGEKMEQLKRALSFCVKSLDARDRFNLVTFSTEARAWKEGLVPASDATAREGALAFISEQKALGGTNIAEALATALAVKKDAERPFLVIFLTDGLPTVGLTDVETILKDAKSKSEHARVFVFGIGNDVNTILLDRLADENRGARDYVGDREDLELKLSSFFRKVSSPVMTDVKLVFEGVKVDDAYPKTMPDLFRGSQAMVVGRYKGSGPAKVRLQGSVEGKPVSHVYDMTFAAASKQPSAPRLWAVRKTGYLLDQIRLNGESKEVRDEVVRLGVKYGIVTPYTSYLVVEDAPAVGAPRPSRGTWSGGRGGAGGAPPPPGAPAGEPADAVERARLVLRDAAKAADDADAEEEFADADRPGEPAGNPTGGATPATRTGAAEGKKDAGRDRNEAGVRRFKEKRTQGESAVEASKAIFALREARDANGVPAGASVKRVGDRTFYVRGGLNVEAAALAFDADALKTRLVRVKAFSPEYFELLAKKPEIAAILALGDVLFVLDGTPYLVASDVEDGASSRPGK